MSRGAAAPLFHSSPILQPPSLQNPQIKVKDIIFPPPSAPRIRLFLTFALARRIAGSGEDRPVNVTAHRSGRDVEQRVTGTPRHSFFLFTIKWPEKPFCIT